MKTLSKKAQEFQNYMTEAWSNCYYDLAGCKYLEIDQDKLDHNLEEVKIIVYDDHCKDEVYAGYYEDGPVLEKVKLKKLKKYTQDNDTYYEGSSFKPNQNITKTINGIDLMKRYGWVTLMFRWINDMNAINPNSFLPAETYTDEKELLKNDPYLAMYWLIRFGFCSDKKYVEVASIIKENNLDTILPFISNVLAFFDETDNYYEMKIPDHFGEMQHIMNGTDLNGVQMYMDGLYLKRRAYIIFVAQSFKNEKDGDLETILDSVLVYPEVEEYLFSRIYWLIVFLSTHNNYKKVDELLTGRNFEEIPFLKDFLKYYSKKLSETENKQIIEGFFEHLLDNDDTYLNQPFYVRELLLFSGFSEFSNRKQLKKVAKTYFKKGTEGYETLKKEWKKD